MNYPELTVVRKERIANLRYDLEYYSSMLVKSTYFIDLELFLAAEKEIEVQLCYLQLEAQYAN